METTERKVSSYKKANGVYPFRVWREGLDRTAKNAINARVTRFATGNFGDSKHVGKGVFESRLDHGPGYRIYYGEDGIETVILLCGGDKSTQNADIKRAQEYWTDYKKRQADEQPNSGL